MNEKEIRDKIKEIEERLKIDINATNYEYYHTLLMIHTRLWDLLYFKTNQEENFLVK